MYSFIYSPIANTSAYSLPEIPKAKAQERLKTLQNLHKKILSDKAKREIGNIHNVMIESKIEESQNKSQRLGDKMCEFEGRSDNGKLIRLKSANPLTIGEIYRTKI